VLTRRCQTITFKSSRQLHINPNYLVAHAHYSTHARHTSQTHLPSHTQLHHNYLRYPIAIWEDYADARFFDFDAMTTSIASSGKRKRSGPRFYAVRVGRKPGIYHSWEDCKAQTDGIKAECESGRAFSRPS
jgi:hypothetical protein